MELEQSVLGSAIQIKEQPSVYLLSTLSFYLLIHFCFLWCSCLCSTVFLW